MQSKLKALTIFLLGAVLLVPLMSCEQKETAEAPDFECAFVNQEFSTYPGSGKKVRPARATWNSGFILEAIYTRALEHMGYEVEKYKEVSGPIFYQSLVDGDLDFWANGWFPLHNKMLPDDFDQKAEKVGYIVKNGAVQGYLASKDLVEEYDIKSLADFKREEVVEAFDVDNDGKAEMVGCPPGWGCHKIITYHMEEAYPEVAENIDVTTGSYSASMSSEVAKHKNGEPVFFYTWTPNWTVNKLKPGEDVLWIGVPEIKPTPEQEDLDNPQEALVGNDIDGAVTDPINMGFAANDIRVVANKEFLDNNPGAKKLFELMSVSFDDITTQNQKMFEGEDTQEDVEKHATEWIKANKDKWIEWQKKAREAAGQ
ncbi:MAG: glycine betaine/L-proline ABC transporter substrate-binding protein ProX [Desulfonatronovibrionaceae bacterium]